MKIANNVTEWIGNTPSDSLTTGAGIGKAITGVGKAIKEFTFSRGD